MGKASVIRTQKAECTEDAGHADRISKRVHPLWSENVAMPPSA